MFFLTKPLDENFAFKTEKIDEAHFMAFKIWTFHKGSFKATSYLSR